MRPTIDGRSISRNVAHLNILVHDVINLLYYVRIIGAFCLPGGTYSVLVGTEKVAGLWFARQMSTQADTMNPNFEFFQ